MNGSQESKSLQVVELAKYGCDWFENNITFIWV